MVFSRRRRDLICTQNNHRKVKNIFEKSEHTVKSMSFWLTNVVLRDKYCQKIEENKPEKPKNVKLLITDYAKVKKRTSMIKTRISSHVRYLLEEKGVRLLFLSLLWSENLY